MKSLCFSLIFLVFCISCTHHYQKSGWYRGCCAYNQGFYACREHTVLCEDGEYDSKCYCTSDKLVLEFSGLNQLKLQNMFRDYINKITTNNISSETQEKLWFSTLEKAYIEGYSPADVEAWIDLLHLRSYNKSISNLN